MQIEGRNTVAEAIKSGITIDKVLVQKGALGSAQKIIDDLKNNKIKINFVDKEILDKESETKHHQGFIAYVTEFKYSSVEDILAVSEKKGRPPFIVILDNVCDPHNLGSIIRTCECADVDGIIISKNRSASVNEVVIRVSQGATSYMKIAKVTNINDVIRNFKEQGIFVMACESDGTTMTKCNLSGALAIVIGSEGDGVSHLTKKLCDGIISIPMFGKINSLNASVATGVVLYEVVRQTQNTKI